MVPVDVHKGRSKQKKSGTGKQTSMEEKLKSHNKKFQSKKQTYEPRKHSARLVRMWEGKMNKKWSSLNVDERIQANADISKMKE